MKNEGESNKGYEQIVKNRIMKKRRLGFTIDKMTNSIEAVPSGTSFETEIVPLGMHNISRLKTLGWGFDWTSELSEPGREVYALVKKIDPDAWQGLVSFSDESDHVFMHLLESAPLNVGRKKLYDGVAANLVAFVCKTSFERGHKGNIAFNAKTRLISHYEKTLGAQRFSLNRMLIVTPNAHQIVQQYFPDFQQ